MGYTGVAARFASELDELSDENMADIPRPDILGELHMQPVVDRLRVIRALVMGLDGQDEKWLSADVLREIAEHLNGTLAVRNRAREFNLKAGQPESVYLAIVRDAEDQRNWFTANVTPLTRLNQADTTADAAAAAAAAQVRAEAAAAAAEAALSSIRPQAAAATAVELSKHYRGQADHHEQQANAFGIAALVVLVITLGIGLWLLGQPIETPVPATALVDYLRGLVPRLFAIGIGLYAVRFTARQFLINKHLKVVNEQRSNALNTFDVVQTAIEAPATRDLVVVEMVRSVFRGAGTGYVEDQSKTPTEEPTSAMVALLNRLTPGS